jgi:hypothetical protein
LGGSGKQGQKGSARRVGAFATAQDRRYRGLLCEGMDNRIGTCGWSGTRRPARPWIEGSIGLYEEADKDSSARTHAPILLRMSKLSMDKWQQGEPCEADGLSFCHRCKPKPFPTTVYVTTGWGAAFHRSENCWALCDGQKMVERRGGSPAPIELVHIEMALSEGCSPCLVCFPEARGRTSEPPPSHGLPETNLA